MSIVYRGVKGIDGIGQVFLCGGTLGEHVTNAKNSHSSLQHIESSKYSNGIIIMYPRIYLGKLQINEKGM